MDEGGFGKVSQVQNVKKPSCFAALKAEPSDQEGGAAIKLELGERSFPYVIQAMACHFSIFTSDYHIKNVE